MIRIGIVGGGFGIIAHLPAFRSIPGCKVVALCGKPGKSIGNVNRYGSWRDMLKNEELDAIAIATPPRAQYEIAKAAIEKGLHVFADKPFTANLKQARELYALAKKKRIVHGIDFEFLEIPEWRKVKELIDRRAFGKLNHVSVSWDWLSGDMRKKARWKTSAKEGGGALSYYFSHGLNYLEHFAGEITDARGSFTYSPLSPGGAEVGVDLLLTFKNGATGNVHVSSNSPGFIRHQLIFFCERGVIVLGNRNAVVNGFTARTYGASGEKEIRMRKIPDRRGEDERVKMVRILTKRFVNACAGKGTMRPSFADGLRVQELIEKIRTSQVR